MQRNDLLMMFDHFDAHVSPEETNEYIDHAEWEEMQEELAEIDAIAAAEDVWWESVDADEEYYSDPVDLYGAEWENNAVREWD